MRTSEIQLNLNRIEYPLRSQSEIRLPTSKRHSTLDSSRQRRYPPGNSLFLALGDQLGSRCAALGARAQLLRVALLTCSRREGRVDIALEELRILGRMRIVALPAVHDRGTYVQMRPSKIRPLGIVAFPTQGLDGLAQQ